MTDDIRTRSWTEEQWADYYRRQDALDALRTAEDEAYRAHIMANRAYYVAVDQASRRAAELTDLRDAADRAADEYQAAINATREAEQETP